MSRKDYETLASIFQRHLWQAKTGEVDAVVRDVIDWLEADNPSFDRTRFIDACSTPPEAS